MDSPNSGSRAAEQIYSITPNYLSQLWKYEKQEILPNARKDITFFMKYCGLHLKVPGSIMMAQRDDKKKPRRKLGSKGGLGWHQSSDEIKESQVRKRE